VILAMDHCLPGKKVFARAAQWALGREKQPLREIAIAAARGPEEHPVGRLHRFRTDEG